MPSAASDKLLRKHAEAGVLIQRKTGNDLPSSITDGRLSRSLNKMRSWSPRRWLVFVGQIDNQQGKGYIDGREGLRYASLIGALDWWQLRGGDITLLSDNRGFTQWVRDWPRRLEVLKENPDKVLVKVPEQGLHTDEKLSMVVGIPGLGPVRARALLETARGEGGTLARALCMLTNRHGSGVEGIGAGITKSSREWVGLEDGQQLAIVDEAKLVDLMEYILGQHTDIARGVPLYATLAEWLGLPCGVSEESWQAWAEEVVEGEGR